MVLVSQHSKVHSNEKSKQTRTTLLKTKTDLTAFAYIPNKRFIEPYQSQKRSKYRGGFCTHDSFFPKKKLVNKTTTGTKRKAEKTKKNKTQN